MSHRYTKSCDQCGKRFTTDRKETRACSKSCAASMAKPLPWLECSKCMAAIGLGLRTTAKLLGHPNPQRVASAWSIRGIQKVDPPDGSWHLYARRRGMHGNTKEMPRLPWWGDEESAKGWRSNEKAKFPDWSIIWYQRNAGNKYASMTDTERKEFNSRCMDNRKRLWARNPDAKIRDLAKMQKWKRENPERNRASVRKSIKARKLRDPGFKIACNLRNRFKEIMEVARDPSRKWNSSLIGCDTHRLAAHLESQFTKGITWENYGTHWHVDHIIPCAAFDHTKPEQVRQCWHFTNLRPLEAKANMAKGAKIEAPQLQLLLTA